MRWTFRRRNYFKISSRRTERAPAGSLSVSHFLLRKAYAPSRSARSPHLSLRRRVWKKVWPGNRTRRTGCSARQIGMVAAILSTLPTRTGAKPQGEQNEHFSATHLTKPPPRFRCDLLAGRTYHHRCSCRTRIPDRSYPQLVLMAAGSLWQAIASARSSR
jgi:hypothetical protein